MVSGRDFDDELASAPFLHSGPARGCWGLLDKVASRSYLGDMTAIGLKALKNQLSEYVRRASAGEIVLVTDRDRVVAELVPPRPDRSPVLADELLAAAFRDGLIQPPRKPGAPLTATTKPLVPLQQLLAELDQDREDR